MKKILITAFEPFGKREVNASAAVLEQLPGEISGCAAEKVLLPVVFGKAAEKALRFPADYIFLLGEAGGRDTVTPEIRGVNLRDARIPDNEGNMPKADKILPDGPEEYRTAFPAEEAVRKMKAEGYRIEVSEDAGRYVCNDTFFLTGIRSRVPVAFIHVPADAERAGEYAGTVRRFIELCVGKGSFAGK